MLNYSNLKRFDNFEANQKNLEDQNGILINDTFGYKTVQFITLSFRNQEP